MVDSQPSGTCFVTDEGACVGNGDGVVEPFVSTSCRIAVLRPTVLTTPLGFNIDQRASVNIGGHILSDGFSVGGGTVYTGQQNPANVSVLVADAIFWNFPWDATNASIFRVCASRYVFL